MKTKKYPTVCTITWYAEYGRAEVKCIASKNRPARGGSLGCVLPGYDSPTLADEAIIDIGHPRRALTKLLADGVLGYWDKETTFEWLSPSTTKIKIQ